MFDFVGCVILFVMINTLLNRLTDTFSDPLIWLWLLLGAVGVVGLGILLSWFFGKPVVKFYIDGEVVSVRPYEKGKKFSLPIDLTEYEWFLDKEQTTPLPQDFVAQKRVVSLYSSVNHIRGGNK